MNKPSHNLIAIKTKKKRRAKFIANNFARDTYGSNSSGEKIRIDQPAGVGALKRAYYQLCTSDLPCVWIRLTRKEARAFPQNHDLNENAVCILAAVHCADGCYGYTIGKCDVDFIGETGREREAVKLAIELAFELAVMYS